MFAYYSYFYQIRDSKISFNFHQNRRASTLNKSQVLVCPVITYTIHYPVITYIIKWINYTCFIGELKICNGTFHRQLCRQFVHLYNNNIFKVQNVSVPEYNKIRRPLNHLLIHVALIKSSYRLRCHLIVVITYIMGLLRIILGCKNCAALPEKILKNTWKLRKYEGEMQLVFGHKKWKRLK